MDHKMEILAFIFCGLLAAVTSITISSNGNSPKIKMMGGMMVDVQEGFTPMKFGETSTVRTANDKSPTKKVSNSTKLSINERYRRLIPYMTFYYANDLANPTTDNAKEVEVEKAQILEAPVHRESKKIIPQYPNRNIPIYQGNRLTHHNIASANPTKVFYKGGVQVYPTQSTYTQNYNPLLSEYNYHNDYDSGRVIYKQTPKTPNYAFGPSTRKPYQHFYTEESPNIRYYLSEKEQRPKYKLVPYEQTPPVKVVDSDNNYDVIAKKPIPVSVLIPKEQLLVIKPRPGRPQYVYENVNVQQPAIRKQPAIVSESYYEKQRPLVQTPQPEVNGGFKPLYYDSQIPKESFFTTALPENTLPDHGHQQQQEIPVRPSPIITIDDLKPNYYQYVVDQTTIRPQTQVTPSTQVPLATLLNSLQLNKSLPKPITKENVGSSIRTLLQVLNALKAAPHQVDAEVPVLSTPKPFVANKVVQIVPEPETETVQLDTEQPGPATNEDLHKEPYLADVNLPSQHLDDVPSGGGTSQQFPLPVTSDDEGGTPGQPGVDYPILTVIPPTRFDCKTQRYKGFFADPETRCQVWHYCDLNGGQASFLCPNGTIFSQAALTCDWWFNVRCATTTQLYVLNESLYKYILPHSPKFPEDYSGPLVDKYLSLKFKEMEEQFKKNKNKQSASDKVDSEEDSEDNENSTESEDSSESENSDKDKASDKIDNEPSVILESPGTSGKVQRLEDE